MIPPHVLKIAAEELAGPLTEIINQCILEKYWPSSLKKGEWIPAFKKEDPLEMSNYRPITILTVVDKIFEQLLSKQMSKFFEPIFDPFVSAYRGLYSCESTLVRLVEDWKQAIDTGKTVGVLSTDMSKAFDTMHPTLLLAKLQAYGFSNESLTLMRSFFMDRKGRTKLGAVVSDWIACSRLSDSRENEKNCVWKASGGLGRGEAGEPTNQWIVFTWRHHFLKSKTKEPRKFLSSSGIRGGKFVSICNFKAQ